MTETTIQLIALIFYKCFGIFAGLACIRLGYNLFVKGIFNEAGDIEGKFANNSILIKKSAPGTVFALAGLAIIATMIWKHVGLETFRPIYDQTVQQHENKGVVQATDSAASLKQTDTTARIKAKDTVWVHDTIFPQAEMHAFFLPPKNKEKIRDAEHRLLHLIHVNEKSDKEHTIGN